MISLSTALAALAALGVTTSVDVPLLVRVVSFYLAKTTHGGAAVDAAALAEGVITNVLVVGCTAEV